MSPQPTSSNAHSDDPVGGGLTRVRRLLLNNAWQHRRRVTPAYAPCGTGALVPPLVRCATRMSSVKISPLLIRQSPISGLLGSGTVRYPG